jgi:hypothetical protein
LSATTPYPVDLFLRQFGERVAGLSRTAYERARFVD